MSQNETILNHMRTRGSITTWIAIKRYRITRLARVIGELEAPPYRKRIIHTPIARKGKRYTAYSLVEPARKAA